MWNLKFRLHTRIRRAVSQRRRDDAIHAGGRYDGLVAYFGGPETPGVGFGMGLERLLLVLDKQGVELPIETALDVYVAVLGAGANGRALELVQALRA